MRTEDTATGDTPASPSLSDPHSPRSWRGLAKAVAGEATQRTVPSKQTEKRAQEFIHRKRRAALAASHPGGSAALEGFVFASSSLSSELSPARAALVHSCTSPWGPRPSARAGVRAPYAAVSRPGSLLGASVPTWPGPHLQRALPAAAGSPPRVSASERCSLLPNPLAD